MGPLRGDHSVLSCNDFLLLSDVFAHQYEALSHLLGGRYDVLLRLEVLHTHTRTHDLSGKRMTVPSGTALADEARPLQISRDCPGGVSLSVQKSVGE